jgi:hypothetical protein
MTTLTPVEPDHVAVYGSTSFQTDDRAGPQGGAIDLTTKIIVSTVSWGTVTLFSTSENDTGVSYLVTGIARGGHAVQETIALEGTVPVSLREMAVMRVQKVGGSAIQGIVTVRTDSKVIGMMSVDPISSVEVTGLRRLFCEAPGSRSFTKTYYEKIFIRNNHELTTLTNINISESLDEENNVEFGFDPSINHDSTSASRLSRPRAVPANQFKSTIRTLPDLEPGNAIGMWVKMAVPAGQIHAVVV